MDTYDLFVSHRGPDVRDGFVSHLEEALVAAGLKPFLDTTSLEEQAGSYVPTVIYNALQGAKVNVVVLSKGYAESEYCLKELVIMIRSFEDEKKPIIPVFYDVDFRDLLRIQRFAGPHGSALKKHEWRGTPRTEVKAWAGALYTVSQMAGYCKAKYCNGGRGGEAALKRDVVAAVQKKISELTTEIVTFQAEGLADKEHAAQGFSEIVDQLFGKPSRCGETQSGQPQTIINVTIGNFSVQQNFQHSPRPPAASQSTMDLVRHPHITCDACGMNPIMGTRYNSSKTYNYDLCQKCFQEDGRIEDYDRIDKPILVT